MGAHGLHSAFLLLSEAVSHSSLPEPGIPSLTVPRLSTKTLRRHSGLTFPFQPTAIPIQGFLSLAPFLWGRVSSFGGISPYHSSDTYPILPAVAANHSQRPIFRLAQYFVLSLCCLSSSRLAISATQTNTQTPSRYAGIGWSGSLTILPSVSRVCRLVAFHPTQVSSRQCTLYLLSGGYPSQILSSKIRVPVSTPVLTVVGMPLQSPFDWASPRCSSRSRAWSVICLIAASGLPSDGSSFPQRFFISSCGRVGKGIGLPMVLRRFVGTHHVGSSPKEACPYSSRILLPLTSSSWVRSSTTRPIPRCLDP